MVGKRNIAKITSQLDKFKKEIKKMGYVDAKYILFGSWAKGKQGEYSDIDVCVVSKKFSGNTFKDNQKLRLVALDINELIEPVTMRPEDLEDKYDSLASEIRKYGVVV